MGDETLPDRTISIHLWEHLWGEQSRTDFVPFHTGLVTPHNIRTIDVTVHAEALWASRAT